jgi:long-subunit acyl-CoA synthetase (AMP-forming)
LEAKILRDDGSEAGYNEEGALWVRSAGVALGYVNNPKANAETFVDGWLNTGDRFKADEKGCF